MVVIYAIYRQEEWYYGTSITLLGLYTSKREARRAAKNARAMIAPSENCSVYVQEYPLNTSIEDLLLYYNE